MNKQEFIDKLKQHGAWCTECHDINGKKDRYVKASKVRELLDRLDEPQAEKVEVPDFVAEWYEHHKPKTLEAKFMHIENAADDRVVNWYEKCKGRHNNPRGNSQEILAMMDLFGYEIEEEPRWVVKYIPPFVDDFRYYSMDDEIFDITESSWTSDKEDAYPFTEKEKAEALALLVDGSVEEV